jgi:hypothetical protein
MEEQGVVGLGALDKPVHGTKDVLLGGLAHAVLLVIGKNDHVLPPVAKLLSQKGCHIAHVIDAAAQLAALAEVIDTDQEGLTATRAFRVLEGIALRSATAELLRAGGRCLYLRGSTVLVLVGYGRSRVVFGLWRAVLAVLLRLRRLLLQCEC